MYNLEITGPRGVTYMDYPDLFQPGEILSRKEVASRAGRHYSTVTYHLERAVSDGMLRKVYCYVGLQPGWGYTLPEKQLELPGFSHD